MPTSAQELAISDEKLELHGDLTLPDKPLGLVLFAHGSGSSRKSPRNRHVARVLNKAAVGTLLFDLLTPSEEGLRDHVFDIGLLTNRLLFVTRWVMGQSQLSSLPIGYFGASTGAAAAIQAASRLKDLVSAVVSRGGRPDLAETSALRQLECPTLLLVGGLDDAVLELNREALAQLPQGELIVIPGASHLFEEEGTLDLVADEAAEWFTRFFARARKKKAA